MTCVKRLHWSLIFTQWMQRLEDVRQLVLPGVRRGCTPIYDISCILEIIDCLVIIIIAGYFFVSSGLFSSPKNTELCASGKIIIIINTIFSTVYFMPDIMLK